MKACSVDNCKEEESLPFKCKLCNQFFCAKHRLPEQHDCPMIGIYQTEQYKKAKYTQTEKKEEKSKKKRPKIYGEDIYTPRDIETKSVYYEPQDRFLTRSSFFNITGFRNDYINIITTLLIFSILVTLNIIVEYTLYAKVPFSSIDWIWIVINISAINFIFGGYFIIQKILARKMHENTKVVLWIWGILLGVLSIFVPLFAIPGFLTFRESSSSYKNRGKIAFSGIAWILFWCTVIVIIMFGQGFGNAYLHSLSFTPMLMLTFALFSLLPFGIYAGKYISGWNRQLYIGTFIFTFILFIVYLIARY